MQRRRIANIIALLTLILLIAMMIWVPRAQTAPVRPQMSEEEVPLPETNSSTSVLQTDPIPTPEKDTCRHYQLSGSINNMWTPAWRWMLFGAMGLVFVYGTYREDIAWVTRKPWKPLWTRIAEWVDERYDVVEPMRKILSKPVQLFATRWMYCLGGITLLLFGILGITGIMLTFYFKPTPEEAYESIRFIENEVRFSAAIRAIHHWSANGMVVMAVAHMLRVFITGTFKPPREFNWTTNVLLGIITLTFGLTGYLLPWDQRAYWATTVATEIAGDIPQIGDLILVFLRGGWDVTAITLSRFYSLHINVLLAGLILLAALYLLMVRRQGITRPL